MTKEVDFLSIGKSPELKNDSQVNTNTTKKEGLSLFDSLMVNNQKKEVSKENTDTKTNNTNPLKQEQQVVEKTKEGNGQELSATKSEKKESTNLGSNSKKVDESEKKETTTNEKVSSTSNESKIEKTSTSTSLLDRMIIEAKKDVKTLNSEKNPSVSKEPKDNNISRHEKESNGEATKSSSLLDKMISQAKTVISSEVEKNDTKIDDKKNIDKEIITKNPDVKLEKNIKNESTPPILKEETKESNLKKDIKSNDTIESKEDSKKVKKDVVELKDTEVRSENKSGKVVLETKVDIQDAEVKITTEPNEKVLKKENITNVEVKKVINKLNNDNTKSSVNIEEKNITNVDTKKIEEKNVEVKESLNIKDSKKLDTNLTEDSKTEKILNNNQDKAINKNIVDSSTKNLAKLEPEAIVKDEQRINIDKKDLLKETPRENNTVNNKSLMDRLLDNAKTNTISSKEMPLNNPLQEQSNSLKTTDVVTNIFLSNQKNSIYNQMLSTKEEGKKVVKEGKSVDDVKKGAEILDLGLKKTSVDIETVTKNVKAVDNFDTDSLLEKLAFANSARKNDTSNLISNITSTVSSSTSATEVVSNLNVNPALALSIQNRIIGAQQHMSSMMSDVAKNMYQNYKPPVTAFRINLFPSQLGHIAILMKNDKDNGISISMNMSNASTLDSFVENQSLLKEALNKNFNNNQTTFDLDFNLQDQNSNQSNQQEQNKKNKENHSSNEILETITQNQNVGEDLNYL